MRLWSALFGVAELCVQNCNPLAFLGGGNPNLLQAAAGILSRNSLEVVLDQSVVFPRVNCKLVVQECSEEMGCAFYRVCRCWQRSSQAGR